MIVFLRIHLALQKGPGESNSNLHACSANPWLAELVPYITHILIIMSLIPYFFYFVIFSLSYLQCQQESTSGSSKVYEHAQWLSATIKIKPLCFLWLFYLCHSCLLNCINSLPSCSLWNPNLVKSQIALGDFLPPLFTSKLMTSGHLLPGPH